MGSTDNYTRVRTGETLVPNVVCCCILGRPLAPLTAKSNQECQIWPEGSRKRDRSCESYPRVVSALAHAVAAPFCPPRNATTCTPPPPFANTHKYLTNKVKGPSDRLSDRQTAWLSILDRGGARVGVCHVVEGSGGSHVACAADVIEKK